MELANLANRKSKKILTAAWDQQRAPIHANRKMGA
jgi:hypothetical protein